MATTSTIDFYNNIGQGAGLGAGDHWDGFVENFSPSIFSGKFQGLNLNWGTYDEQASLSLFINTPYSGYTTNFGAQETLNSVISPFVNTPYAGYTTNWGTNDLPIIKRSATNVDINSVVDHPKDQTIYYKLKGFNTNTNAYESWVISENITSRPEQYDSDHLPPNIDDGIYYTAPSGNPLVNVTIVGRWIE